MRPYACVSVFTRDTGARSPAIYGAHRSSGYVFNHRLLYWPDLQNKHLIFCARRVRTTQRWTINRVPLGWRSDNNCKGWLLPFWWWCIISLKTIRIWERKLKTLQKPFDPAGTITTIENAKHNFWSLRKHIPVCTSSAKCKMHTGEKHPSCLVALDSYSRVSLSIWNTKS